MAIEDLLISYFRAGFTYNEIVGILSSHHETNTSVRTLHGILQAHGMKRGNSNSYGAWWYCGTWYGA